MTEPPVLEIVGLEKHFAVGSTIGRQRGQVKAVDGVSLTIGRGEVLGLVGESGSGKSTVGKCIMRLLEPTAGQILLNGVDVARISRREMRPFRRQMHMVFQDPYSSLNPRMTNAKIVSEPLRMHGVAHGRQADELVVTMFEKVGLPAEFRHRYPHELSGGQRQRIGLARALILEPTLLIADEPVSALDVSVQASILNLLMDLQRDMGFSCLFITHDLATMEIIGDRAAVMYLGTIAETGACRDLFSRPKHPYTQALLSAVAVADPSVQRNRSRVLLGADVPSPLEPPSGCTFHTRCPVAEDQCRTEVPALRDLPSPARSVRCHLVLDDGTAPDVTVRAGPSPERTDQASKDLDVRDLA